MRLGPSIKCIVAVLAAAVFANVAKAEDITLKNGKVALTFSTSRGRIMSFHLNGKPNVLWTNETKLRLSYLRGYPNYGGDKIWLVLQKQRRALFGNRLPDPVIDGKPWKVIARSERSLTVKSQESPAVGVVVTRKITLDDKRPVAVIENSVTRKRNVDVPVYIWQVSQAVRPDAFYMGINPAFAPDKKAYYPYRKDKSESKIEAHGDALKIVLPKGGWDKINAWGEWLAAAVDSQLFIQICKFEPGGKYVDDSSTQVYSNEHYIEMETLSPAVNLPKGSTYSNRIVWGLVPLKSGSELKQIKDFVLQNDIGK